jgi:hypothetical protein
MDEIEYYFNKPQAILYSVKQDCFHSEGIKDYITENCLAIIRCDKSTDFRMIGVAENIEQQHQIIEGFKRTLVFFKLRDGRNG